ncbi:MAG: mechanosensitive ion channel family protein [Anaerolineales bacterium]|nr:mechanosensitive ion channel family protein [Anaerolineales bacterium]
METWNEIWANEFYRKLILSVLVLSTQAVIRSSLLNYVINRISVDSSHLYVVRKVAIYMITIVTTLLLFGIWIQQLGDLSVALGILAAGLAFALQEVIGSVAGWTTIITGNPFSIGDRIETGGIRGDVVDIGVLRTTLMEIGNWVSGDHNTGRIVTLSNAFIFKEPLYNYSAHLRFVWDEVRVPITYESNWKKGIEILANTVIEHPAYKELLPKAQKQRRELRRRLAVKMTPIEPRTYVKITDNWIELSLVYPVDTDLRRSFRSEISQRLLAEFEAEGIKIASQTIAIVEFPSDSSTEI